MPWWSVVVGWWRRVVAWWTEPDEGCWCREGGIWFYDPETKVTWCTECGGRLIAGKGGRL